MTNKNRKNLGQAVSNLVETALLRFLDPTGDAEIAIVKARRKLPAAIALKLDNVLSLPQVSYRDGVVIQLAFGLEDGAVDLTVRPEGGRSVSQRLGLLFKSKHIKGVADAYQNIAKNTDELCRGNQPDFDDVLRWADDATADERQTAFEFVIASVALTARPVQSMPRLNLKDLTFYRVAKLMDELLNIPSAGAHEQFSVAAFIHALIEEFGLGGPSGLRVETKRLNASDASSKTAGDIQILRGNRVEEAFEVTANDWATKIDNASRTLKDADLQRAHIVATVGASFLDEANQLGAVDIDVSVIDVSALLRTLIAVMRKPARYAALARLHDYLDRYQPEIGRVNAYVDLLRKHRLTA